MMMTWNTTKKKVLILGLCAWLPLLNAKEIHREFQNLSVSDGLPHSTVNSILQDHIGYIWISTNDGLARFNSHKFTVYKQDPKDSTSIATNQVYTLFEDRQNTLWVGTKVSLERYNREKDQFKSYCFVNVNKNFSEKVPVIDIFQYSDSLYLIGTDGGGLYSFNPYENKYQQYKTIKNDTVTATRISQICQDKEKNIWLTSLDAGVLKFDIKTGLLSRIGLEELHNTETRSIIEYKENKLLIGTYGKGLWTYDTEKKHMAKCDLSKGKYASAVKRIFSLRQHPVTGDIFIGSDGGGMIKYNPENKRVDHYLHFGYNPFSINNDLIRTIFVNKNNNLWIGHYKGGISFSAKKKPFHNVRNNPALNNTLSNNLVSAILKDSKGNIWLGTDGGGLNILKKDGTITNSITGKNPIVEQLPSKSIISLYKDRSHDIWIGTYLDGVYRYSAKTGLVTKFGSTKSSVHKLNNDDIRCFYEDRKGRMWIGTNGGGINIYDPRDESITVIKRDEKHLGNSLSLDWIRCIIEDSYGFIWIGTAYGLNKYDPINKKFTKYLYDENDTSSISNSFIFTIFEDAQKCLWIGTSSGLNKYNRNKDEFISFTTEDGLPDNIIYGIEEDTEKCLWISTNNGLSKFNTSEKQFSNFDIDDGLLSNSFINGAIFRTNNNIIYLGSVNGLTYFNPSEITPTIDDAPLVITGFKIFNKPVPIGKKIQDRVILENHISKTDHITVSYKENVLSFEYTALNYDNPNKIKYAYRLENFDKNWNFNEGPNNSATYTGLNPGDYVFRVKTTNLVNNKETSLNITVTPLFYQTIWFKLLIILIIGSLIYYLNHNRILKIKNQKAILENKLLEDQFLHEKEQINLRNEKLKSEMNFKNAQLTSYTLLITHKNDIMKEIKNKLTTFAPSIQKNGSGDKIKELIDAIDKEFKVEKDWERFEEHFNQIHKDFFTRLKREYPDLSSTYLKLGAYLKMNLSSKEIASLMNISVRGVEKARSRLRKKLELPQSKDLNSFISSI
jgi:ligand-binding sensor domain-containing protein